MNNPFYIFLHKQILILIALSVIPGLGYIVLGWLYGNVRPALIWYVLILISSVYGLKVYSEYELNTLDKSREAYSYRRMQFFYYSQFALWILIFILYTSTDIYELHYIAIFTQLGAAVVAATLLVSDKKLYVPIITLLMIPLSIYFFFVGEWYSYVLSIFSLIFMGVLLYSAQSSYELLMTTHFQANHDSLTRIKNRHYVIDYLQKVIEQISKSNTYSYILLIDLDHFKTINDSLGHDVGDRLLIEVTDRMKALISHTSTLARLGGDEFIVIGAICDSEEKALHKALECAKKLLDRIKDHYAVDQNYLSISASIGVSLLSDKSSKANTFIKEADIAMYEAKDQGRNGIVLFNNAMSQKVALHLEIERHLHFALENNEISLNFQAQCNKEKRVIGCEVLMRWNSKDLGPISPVDFIPIAEQTGLILDLGHHVLKESLKTLQQWDEQGLVLEQFSVNISMRQMFHPHFIKDVTVLCDNYLTEELRACLIFEITESMVAENLSKVISVMKSLKNLGIRFSMDDFGTGYSSLSYLKQLPIYELKIDQSFVSHLEHNSDDREMISIICEMAKRFNLSTVAEGTETCEQMDFLVEVGCDILQGYFFSKPKSKEDFEAYWLSTQS